MERCKGDLLSQYSVISARNAAGFMNLNLSFSNFEHRQDYPLGGVYFEGNADDYLYISGKAFESKEELEKYEEFLKDAQERDHRKIGKEMQIPTIQVD